jgi:hypothetical protein
MQLRTDEVIAVEQARKLLGDESLEMTDEEVKDLIEDFDILAQYTIKMVQNFK